MVLPGRILVVADDLAVVVDPARRGGGRVREVNRGELASAQKKAVILSADVGGEADDLTVVVDPSIHGRGSPRDVDRREVAPAEHEAVALTQSVVVTTDDRAGVVSIPG